MIGARVIRAALPGRHSGGMLDSLAPARRRRARRVSIHTGLAARGQTTLEQPALECRRRGIVGDGAFQQGALDTESDRIGSRVALAPAPPALRGLERGEQLAADGGRPRVHRRHHRRVRGWQPRAQATTRTSSAPPTPAGRVQPRSSAATSRCTVARSSSRTSPTAEAPSVVMVFTHAPQAAQPSARCDAPASAPTRPRRRVCSSVPQNGQRSHCARQSPPQRPHRSRHAPSSPRASASVAHAPQIGHQACA